MPISKSGSSGVATTPMVTVLGDATKLVAAHTVAVFELSIIGNCVNSNKKGTGSPATPSSNGFNGTTTSTSADASGTGTPTLSVHVLSPSKRSIPVRVLPSRSGSGTHSVEFTPTEVGTHLVDVHVGGTVDKGGQPITQTLALVAKVYDAGLIQVTDVTNGVVGQAVNFRVDASQAGEGQLEISINDGEVPNHVQVVGGGRCLVSFTPEQAKPHLIDIKFNGETVRGCPFVCPISDTSRVSVNLSHLELVPVGQVSTFHMQVDPDVGTSGTPAELAVAVRSPTGEIPVKVTGDMHVGFTAEFTPVQVGPHQINIDYNGRPLQHTPHIAKAFDSTKVQVGAVSRGTVGRAVTFSVDASEAGEGNLEITISARELNIPTQVHPQGNARFAVTFVPVEACDHVVNVAFNKRPVQGCPLVVNVGGGSVTGGPTVTLPGPGPVHKPTTLLINHSNGRLEDIEVNVEGPGGQAVPTQVQPVGNNQFRAEFVPRVVGEHRISVSVNGVPTAGSPYAAKVYDVSAIKVKEAGTGVVGKPVTFLVETSQAGPGNLEVTVNGGRVPTSAQAQGAHTYAISFTPREPTTHTVDLRFNGQDVPGSPFKCAVTPAARVLPLTPDSLGGGVGGAASGGILDKVPVGRPCTFVVESVHAPIVEVLGPARRSLQTRITAHAQMPDRYEVTFTPLDVGDHSVEVRQAASIVSVGSSGGHVEGGPFLVEACDANRVTVTDIADGTVGKAVSFSINASQAGAGNLEIIVAVGGRNVPNFVQSEGNARFKVNFEPTEAAIHTLSVRFNGQPVPGSPFSCKVLPGNSQPRVPVTGAGLEMAAVGQMAEIRVEANGDVQVMASSPAGESLPTKVTVLPNGQFVAHFRPEHVGRHSIAVLLNEHHVLGSPFSCNVFDVQKVVVSGLGSMSAHVGKPITFNVDAAQAGEGTLELVVSTQHTTIKAEVVACARGLYDVTFVPQTAEDHYVSITFNDMAVHGSPFHCPVLESTKYLQVGCMTFVDLPNGGDPTHRLEIVDHNRHHVKYTVNGTRAEFSLPHVGGYTLQTFRNGELLASTEMHAFDMSKMVIQSVPDAICHRPATVTINTAKVGVGLLEAIVKVGARTVAHTVRPASGSGSGGSGEPHTWELIFHPVQVAPHRITLYFNGVPKYGAVIVPVRGPGHEPCAVGLGLYQARVGKVTAFHIEAFTRTAREFDVVVSGPLGAAVPVRCYQTKTGKLQAEFTTREVGVHTVEVLHQAKPLSGSPFTCQSFDPDAVHICDIPQTQGNVGESVTFGVNTRNAGVADVEVQVTNPIGQTVPVEMSKNLMGEEEGEQSGSANIGSSGSSSGGVGRCSFMPTMAGLYQVMVSYGGVPVRGSPLALGVGPVGPTPPPRAVGKGLEWGIVAERTFFTVTSVVQPRVQIDTIEGAIEAHIRSPKAGEYLVSYTPKWVGTYDIIISIGPSDLAGSPFRPNIIDPSAVRVIGGWAQHLDDEGRIRLPTRVAFDVSQAGPGTLECRMGSRNVNPVEKSVIGRTKFDLSGEGLSAGPHPFEVRFGGVLLADTPIMVLSAGDGQVALTGKGLAQAQCGEPASFTIDGSKATTNGTPEVTLVSSGTNVPVPVMMSLAGERMWKATYTVNMAGNYLLTVLWGNRPVRGCPLIVEAKGGADASKVLCSGEGLRQGVVGKEIRSWIDTRRAGPGELTAHCTGPHKVAYCELYDHGDATFTLNVKPQEAGRHALTIKYAGQHVPGSPFTLKVAGAPDASKVRVYGPGIEHGVLATFQSRFICDTRGAGAGQLTVRVRGPKGAFRVEMQRESQRDRTILCKYDPTEPGDYRVEVKWAGELVPGSPFQVMIFDTLEELRRYVSSL